MKNDQKSIKNAINVKQLSVVNHCSNFQLDTIIFDPTRDVFVFIKDDVIHSNAVFQGL